MARIRTRRRWWHDQNNVLVAVGTAALALGMAVGSVIVAVWV